MDSASHHGTLINKAERQALAKTVGEESWLEKIELSARLTRVRLSNARAMVASALHSSHHVVNPIRNINLRIPLFAVRQRCFAW